MKNDLQIFKTGGSMLCSSFHDRLTIRRWRRKYRTSSTSQMVARRSSRDRLMQIHRVRSVDRQRVRHIGADMRRL
jgi:hypothetical protein